MSHGCKGTRLAPLFVMACFLFDMTPREWRSCQNSRCRSIYSRWGRVKLVTSDCCALYIYQVRCCPVPLMRSLLMYHTWLCIHTLDILSLVSISSRWRPTRIPLCSHPKRRGRRATHQATISTKRSSVALICLLSIWDFLVLIWDWIPSYLMHSIADRSI